MRQAPSVILQPPAKLNLTLEVLRRRSDGYHELASVFQAIDLRDTLRIWPADDLTIDCDQPADQPEIAEESNLALLAARLLRETAGISAGARLALEKRIPVAAGLGGGSADAAAALVGLNQLWGLGYSRVKLAEVAARIGSDVPFFLGSPTALVRGCGEVLFRLPPLPPHLAVVVKPRLAVPADKTRRLYAALDPGDYRLGTATEALVRALEAGGQIEPTLLVNSFDRAAREIFPELHRAVAALVDAQAPFVRLAGSGPCLYTLLPDDVPGQSRSAAIAESLRASGMETYVARTLVEPPL